MNFFDKFLTPLSAQHIELLHFMLMLIFSLFIPFVGLITGGSFFSYFFYKKGKRENSPDYIRFSKEIIEIVKINKSMGVVLGFITLLTSILIYIQLLSLSEITSIFYLIISLFVIIAGLLLTYNSFTSKFGFIFLLISIWIFVAGITIPIYKNIITPNDSIINIMFSSIVIFKFITVLLLSGVFTGSTILFIYFYWNGGRNNINDKYALFIKHFAIRLTFSSIIILPLFLFMDLVKIPNDALSVSVFVYSSLAIAVIFVTYHFLYIMSREKNSNFSLQIFVSAILIIILFVIKDQISFDNATELRTVEMSSLYSKNMDKLTGANKAPKISGEDIYKNICSSCHSFDHKVVGPPYKQTLPKYKGNVDKLVVFILHPTQNNPGYPPMPNPGLKPDQAKAVATYILNEVKKYE